jgi:methionyl-tRNA formyltransferase
LRNAADLTAPNSPEGLDVLRETNPDLIVSVRYRRILGNDAIAVPRHGVLNLHSGILPDYQGVMASFWAMLNGEPELGATLHWIVDSGIDTGPIINISRIRTRPAESYLANVLRLYVSGCVILADAVSELARGKTVPGELQSPGDGRYFSSPGVAALEHFSAKNLYLTCGTELSELHDPGRQARQKSVIDEKP